MSFGIGVDVACCEFDRFLNISPCNANKIVGLEEACDFFGFFATISTSHAGMLIMLYFYNIALSLTLCVLLLIELFLRIFYDVHVELVTMVGKMGETPGLIT